MVAINIAGRKHWLQRAVDEHGVALDLLVQSRRNAKAAKRLLCKLLKKQDMAPLMMVTDVERHRRLPPVKGRPTPWFGDSKWKLSGSR